MSFTSVLTALETTITSITENSTPTFNAQIGHPDKVVIKAKEPAYIEMMSVDEFEDTFSHSFDMNNPVAVISVYAKGQDTVSHKRALKLVDLVFDAIQSTPTLNDAVTMTLPLRVVWGEREQDKRLLRGGQVYLKLFKE